MADNRYFIVNLPNSNMSQIYDLVDGGNVGKRKSIDETKMVVKLPLGDDQQHGVLQNATEFTHAEILIELAKPEWRAVLDE